MHRKDHLIPVRPEAFLPLGMKKKRDVVIVEERCVHRICIVSFRMRSYSVVQRSWLWGLPNVSKFLFCFAMTLRTCRYRLRHWEPWSRKCREQSGQGWPIGFSHAWATKKNLIVVSSFLPLVCYRPWHGPPVDSLPCVCQGILDCLNLRFHFKAG
jgi:hypothetical protein